MGMPPTLQHRKRPSTRGTSSRHRNNLFVAKSDIPTGCKLSYANFVFSIRPLKEETHRFRMSAGGDQLKYPSDPSSPATLMLDAKLHINGNISDAHRGARYFGVDFKNIFLGTPMKYYQYIRVLPNMISQEVWYDLRYAPEISANGYVYIDIRRAMYGPRRPPSLHLTN